MGSCLCLKLKWLGVPRPQFNTTQWLHMRQEGNKGRAKRAGQSFGCPCAQVSVLASGQGCPPQQGV